MKGKGRYWEVPLDQYPTLNQGAVVLSGSRNKELASRFLDYLRTPPTQKILRLYGFSMPSAQP